MDSNIFDLLLRDLWDLAEVPQRWETGVSTAQSWGLEHRMLLDGMREVARGIIATFHCLWAHREKKAADSSWGCTMEGQETKATSFSNGNSDWVLGISFSPHHSVYTQEQGPSKGGSGTADPADFSTLSCTVSQGVWFVFEVAPALSKSLQNGPLKVLPDTTLAQFCDSDCM